MRPRIGSAAAASVGQVPKVMVAQEGKFEHCNASTAAANNKDNTNDKYTYK